MEPELAGLDARIDKLSGTSSNASDRSPAANESLSEFLVESGRERAERLLTDRTRLMLSPARWREFVVVLDRAPRETPELVELFRRPRPE